MKKRSFIIAFAAATIFASCGDKKTEETYSNLTVEQHKEKFVESGIEVVNEMEEMSDMPALHAASDLLVLLDEESAAAQALTHSIKATKLLSGEKSGLSLKATSEEVIGFMEDYNKEKGVYTYNFTTGEFDKTAGNDYVIKFPIGTSTTNNGEFAFTGLKYITQEYVDIDNIAVEQPTAFAMTLKNSTTSLMAYTFSATYNSDGFPTNLTEQLTMGNYVIYTKFTYSSSTITAEQSFKHNSKNILSCSFSTSGNFSYDNIVENGNSEDPSNQDVISSTNAMFALGNYKLQAGANWKDLKNALTNETSSEEAYYKELASTFNKNAKLHLKYYDSNEIIAASEYYAYEEIDEWYDDYSYWTLGMRMKFNDGSVMDDSLFEDGMEDLENSFDNMIEEFDTNYSIVE